MSTPLAAPGREATSFFGKQQIHQSRSVGRRKIADNRLLDHSQHINPSLLKGCVGALELLTMAAVGYLIVQFYVPHLTPELNASYLTAIGLTSGVFVAIADSLGLYRRRSFSQVFGSVPRLVLAVALALGALAISMLFLKITGVFSRVWFLTWFVSGTAALVTGRLFLAACVAHWTRNGQLSRRAVIYGGGEDCERLLAALESDPECDLAIIGIFDDCGSARTGESISGYPRIGTLGELIEL